MISSPGGSVFHGLSLHNWLKGAPIEVVTYNFGSVDSIGVVISCAGDPRLCVPHARFLMHGVSANFQGNQSLDEKDLDERIKGLRIDYQNIARVVADTTGKQTDDILRAMEARTTLDPEEARRFGLVHEITSALFPAGADLTSIDEGGGAQMATGPMQRPMGMPPHHASGPTV
jgi:ATP-dependent protease ClpP protease subunit